MRRTLLSVLVAVGSFAVTAAVLIGGFQLVAGSSEPPEQGSSRRAAQAEQGSAEATRAPAGTHEPNRSTTGALGGTGIGFGPGTGPVATEPEATKAPTDGLLSEDFRKLGLDDPTTAVDERLPSACDVVDGEVVGPVTGSVLCLER